MIETLDYLPVLQREKTEGGVRVEVWKIRRPVILNLEEFKEFVKNPRAYVPKEGS